MNQEASRNPEYTIEYCHEKINPEWDAFVEDNMGSIFQTSAWANYEFQYNGWRNIRFFVKAGGIIIAGCQMTIIRDCLMGEIGYVQSGPCFAAKNPDVMGFVTREMKKNVQVLDLAYLLVSPNYGESDLAPVLENENFESVYPNLPPYSIETRVDDTLFLDLNMSADDILKQMKSMRRRGIQKGLKSPVQVRIGGRDDLKIFYDLYQSTTSRHPYIDPVTQAKIELEPLVDSYDELRKLWDELSARGWVKLFLGTVEDEVVCGAMSYTFGKTFYYYHWGWNGKYGEYHISDRIQWEMIQWAKTNGFQLYDFVQVDMDVAKAFLSSEPVPEDIKARHVYGPTMFKLQFGGHIVHYPQIYAFYSDKVKHMIDTAGSDFSHVLKLYKDFYWPARRCIRSNHLVSDVLK